MDNLELDKIDCEQRVGIRRQSIASIATPSPILVKSPSFRRLDSFRFDGATAPIRSSPRLSTAHSSELSVSEAARANSSLATPSTPASLLHPPWRGGFSAEEFARYEQMLAVLTPVSEHTAGKSSFDFDRNRDVEKGWRESALSGTTISTLEPKQYDLPAKRQPQILRFTRHTLLNVYRRLFSLVSIANAVAMIWFLHDVRGLQTFREQNGSHIATAAASNILVGTAIRQDYIINALYRTSWLVPHFVPLSIRCKMAKIYEFGGVHSACGIWGTLWLVLLAVWQSAVFGKNPHFAPATAHMAITYGLVAILVTILVLAYPTVRFAQHNLFEMSHRFLGWLAVALFWVLVVLKSAGDGETWFDAHTVGMNLVHDPAFWELVIITFHIILPWLYLRRWTFESEKLSTHAIRLSFQKKLKPFVGIAISDSPLTEWHSFATFPALRGEEGKHGGSLIVSIAGDWTKKTANNPRPTYWVRGRPRAGVLSTCVLFSKVVIVTTGSGIGPCLGVMIDAKKIKHVGIRVLWSAPSPLGIYGPTICDAVRDVDPRATIIDTRSSGRPDMLKLAYQMFMESKAEAVFVISNPMLTRKIVYGFESRGIPAYGPIWDS